MRLIDVDETIINFGFEWDDISPTRDEFVSFLKKQPTIEAKPVVHAHWKRYPDCGVTKCSNCGWSIEECWDSKWCPECGAQMDEEEG